MQAEPSVLEGKVTSSGNLRISDEEFDEPNTNDILGCNSGSFTTGQTQTRNAITPHASFRTAHVLHAGSDEPLCQAGVCSQRRQEGLRFHSR
jgi:hypothetical protein